MNCYPRIATVPLLLLAGCASHAVATDEAGSVTASHQMMESPNKLSQLVGQWSGNNRLWVMPGDPVRESVSTASVVTAARGAVLVITYTWAYEGKPQEGILVVRTDAKPGDPHVVMVDSWHTRNEFMQFRTEDRDQGLVAVRGSYSAGEGPDWGWRIVLGSDGADDMHILMYNITPDGQEMLAVDARYARA